MVSHTHPRHLVWTKPYICRTWLENENRTEQEPERNSRLQNDILHSRTKGCVIRNMFCVRASTSISHAKGDLCLGVGGGAEVLLFCPTSKFRTGLNILVEWEIYKLLKIKIFERWAPVPKSLYKSFLENFNKVAFITIWAYRTLENTWRICWGTAKTYFVSWNGQSWNNFLGCCFEEGQQHSIDIELLIDSIESNL